ncbi:hypothetical protein KBTX_02424 [wastewater metagenome]|uniref:GGDEF domain-containing protein n=3 Tax=root TaxID=1 RepID=A0A5B8RGV7_9ZZZZ|nr:hypothetical protein KBTEX_02424 [uncultured organism]
MIARLSPMALLVLAAWMVARTVAAAQTQEPVRLPGGDGGPVGEQARYLRETGGPLTLAEAVGAFHGGRFSAGGSPVLAFGIGARPVWIRLEVVNAAAEPRPARLTVATAWLDDVTVYIRRNGRTVAAYHTGDREPYAARPVAGRYFAVDHRFAPGAATIYLRVATPDPMVVPLYLETPAAAAERDLVTGYGYGFLYGFLFALVAYNLMLFAGLRQARYALYALYLGAFLLMNLSYTGHGFAWLWPRSTGWAQWSNPVLMLAYATTGLTFALSFLDTREHFPRLRRAVIGYIAVGAASMLAAVTAGYQAAALVVAFTFMIAFTVIMLALGIVSVRAGLRAARYFLLAAVSSMIGAAVTAMAVWGFIPFNAWTYRAVDIGMLVDATLLALALSYRFREGQAQRVRAERLARIDPLTGVNNRRAFHDVSARIWNLAVRNARPVSLALIDLDHFKQVNDRYGHTGGDEALKAVARVLRASVRDYDVLARWGGEEFVLLMPETELAEAVAFAERLCAAVAAHRAHHGDDIIAVTASVGVAGKDHRHRTLDDLLADADRSLYAAKDGGRDQVRFDDGRGVARAGGGRRG